LRAYGNQIMKPNIAELQLTLLLRIRKVLHSNLGPKSRYSDMGVL